MIHYIEYDPATGEGREIDPFKSPDLVAVVRCRDCVHYKPYRTHKHGMMNRCHDEHGHTHKRDENDFCSRGERRTDDN